MSGVKQSMGETAPVDEWLAGSDDDVAATNLRLAEFEVGQIEARLLRHVDDKTRQQMVLDDNESGASDGAALAEAYQAAIALRPNDRLRLAARLWASLPHGQRSALIRFQLNDIGMALRQTGATISSPVWDFFFDPARTSTLYSAPQRFDLATVFVVTAAYSLLFGGLTALDASPLVKITLGGLVTLVAAAQGLLRGRANPRGVSVVVGLIFYTLFSLILWSQYPRTFLFNSFIFVFFINGILGGAFLGYLAGALVGGMFLVADALRGTFDRGAKPSAGKPSDGAAE